MEPNFKRTSAEGWTLGGGDVFQKRQRLLEDSLSLSGPKAATQSVTLEDIDRHEKDGSRRPHAGLMAAASVSSQPDISARSDPTAAERVRMEVGLPSASDATKQTASRPMAMLRRLSKSDVAQRFLRERRAQLLELSAGQSTKKEKEEAAARIFHAVATFHEILGDIRLALEAVIRAVDSAAGECESASSASASTDVDLYRYMQERLTRQMLMDDLRARELLAPGPASPPEPEPVPRVSAQDLTFEEFFNNYAKQKKAVIITDAVASMSTTPWSLEHMVERIGHLEAEIKVHDPESREWARLETARTMKVADFVRSVITNPDEKGYLFDWSVPIHAPDLAQEVSIPRYFANNFLQRTPPGTLNRDSWPSLFIAPAGVRSEMHIDAFGSNFWMALMEGKKKWTFFRPEDAHLLYPEYTGSLDPTFAVSLDDPDVDAKFPAFARAVPTECVLEAGELLFVPAGSPHTVLNLTRTLALSGNVVDASNVEYAVRELREAGLAHRPYRDLADVLTSPAFDRTMDMSPGDVPCSRLLGKDPGWVTRE